MAAFFVDLDGTIFKHGTNDPLPGAIDFLRSINKKGHQLFFTTRRGKEFSGHTVYDTAPTYSALRMLKSEYGIEYDDIIFNVVSPRVVVNDDGAYALSVETNNSNLPEDCDSVLK